MIPGGITRQHVLDALAEIRQQGVPDQRQSTRYCLEYEGRHYPPKYVISLACRRLTGEELPATLFNGGYETNSELNRLGFSTIDCKCGGLRRSLHSEASPGPPAPSGPLSVSSPMPPAPSTAGTELTEGLYPLLYTLPRRDHRTRRVQLPENGVYLFFERGETVRCRGATMDRVVRVGTHDADGRLHARIHYHYAATKNQSVFRAHLGAALMARARPDDPRIRDWLDQRLPTHPTMEAAVTRLLRESFSFVCFRVETRAERLALEAALIAQLARHPLGKPTRSWLGHHAANPAIPASGLWNVRHLESNPLTPAQFSRLEQLIRAT